MDYKKIGNFIASERKAKKLTQSALAKELFVSEKTISKWENGNGIPDTDTLPKLCEVLNITINELLNGERILTQNYLDKAESKLLELQKTKRECDKKLLLAETILCIVASLFLFTLVFMSSFVKMQSWVRITLIVFGFIVFMASMFFAIRIEQKVGYYECKHCHHKFIPSYNQVLWSMHVGRTRFIKCPKCKKSSWSRKVLK